MLSVIVTQDCWNSIAAVGGYFQFLGDAYRVTGAARKNDEPISIELHGKLAEWNERPVIAEDLPDLTAQTG
jgi:hypothetical protein